MYERIMRLLFLVSAICLAGCASVPITSIPKLGRIDFKTTDLSQLRVAMVLPKILMPKGNSIEMVTKLSFEGESPQTNKLQLAQSSAPADLAGLPTDLAPDQKIYVYLLPPAERAKLEQTRRDAQLAKAKGKKGTLDISFAFKEFCSEGALSAAPILTSTYLSSSETDGYVPLNRNLDLRKDAALRKLLDDVPKC
jgi:hypothetical protein